MHYHVGAPMEEEKENMKTFNFSSTSSPVDMVGG